MFEDEHDFFFVLKMLARRLSNISWTSRAFWCDSIVERPWRPHWLSSFRMDWTASGKTKGYFDQLRCFICLCLFIVKAIEKLTQSIHELSEMLMIFIKQCDEIEFPNAVESTRQLLIQHSTQKNELEQELKRIKTYVRTKILPYCR